MSKTRTQLETSIRYKLREATAKEHSPDAILDAINDVAIDVWDELSRLPGCEYCETDSAPVDIVAGTDSYAKPAGMVVFAAVQVWDGSNWRTLGKITAQQWERELDPGYVLPIASGQIPNAYKLLANTVILRPTPQVGITGGLRFIGSLEFTDIAGANDTSGMPHVLDPVIVNLAAATLLLEEGNSAATAWEAKGQARRAKAMERLAVRDGAPRTMNTEFEAEWDDNTP